MKKLLMIVGGLAIAAIAAIVIVGMVAKDKFEPYARTILTDCEAGAYDKVYAATSAPFKKATSLEQFKAFMEARRRALGSWKAIHKTTGGGMATSTETGTTGKVSMELTYERGPADAEFQFVKEGDEWRLLHMTITFDEKLAPPADPAPLEKMSRDLLALYDAQAFTALYTRFSKPLQEAWKADAYEPQMRALHAKAGKVVEAEALPTEAPKDGKHERKFKVRFENGPGDATFGWMWANAEWHLVAVDIHTGPR